MSELTKQEKKLARELIDKGLQIEFANSLKASAAILKEWESGAINNHEAHAKLYGSVIKHNKHIALHYDGMGGSRYLDTVAYLLLNDLITEADIAGFNDDSRNFLLRWKKVSESR